MSGDPGKSTWPLGGAVLIVDDDEVVRRTYAAQLEQLGCECYVAASYDEALLLLSREADIEVVIADHAISGCDTGQFVKSLRNTQPGVMIVGSSGRHCEDEFAELGVERFLRKPWQSDQLVELLSGRIRQCVSCGFPLPLRRPFPGEEPGRWICSFCGGRYRAVLDKDAPPDCLLNARSADPG